VLGTLFKLILALIFLAAIGLVGYAYLGDLTPDTEDVRQPVTLDVD
jgi:hypothetical protein